jgi:thiamine-monophosphate kinase
MGKKRAGGVGAGGELEVIRQIRERAGAVRRGSGLRLGIGDDCALIRPGRDEELAVTTDLSIAGRHFRLDWHPPEAVGHRALVRGLSDLAAMGARPVAAFLSLGVPRELAAAPDRTRPSSKTSWVDSFLNGFFALAKTHGVPLAGGDLAESPVALADIVLVGAVPRGTALLRSGARAGDRLYVTGTLGGAAVGLKRLAELNNPEVSGPFSDEEWHDALSPQLHPKPRIRQGLALRRRGLATAAIDLSDGLSTDLAHLCEESGVSATIQSELLPLAKGATLDQALNGGEDYELLFTARPKTLVPRSIAGVPITCIGHINEGVADEPAVMIATGRVAVPLEARGWQHFSKT